MTEPAKPKAKKAKARKPATEEAVIKLLRELLRERLRVSVDYTSGGEIFVGLSLEEANGEVVPLASGICWIPGLKA